MLNFKNPFDTRASAINSKSQIAKLLCVFCNVTTYNIRLHCYIGYLCVCHVECYGVKRKGFATSVFFDFSYYRKENWGVLFLRNGITWFNIRKKLMYELCAFMCGIYPILHLQ